MIIQIYVLLLAFAMGFTLLIIALGTAGRIGPISVDRRAGIVLSGFGFLVWGLLTVHAFEITIVDGGTTTTESYPELAFLAAAGGALALYAFLQAVVQEIRATGGV